MHYEARWTNGYWKLFDPNTYTDILCFDSEKALREAMNRMAPTKRR